MGVAETLRNQRGGWERAVVNAVGGKHADPAAAPETVGPEAPTLPGAD